MGLELESRITGTAARIDVRGDVDMATAPELRRQLTQLIDDGVTEIVLDCRALEFLDSSGIGVLVAALARLDHDGALVLESPPANVRKVLEVTGVDRQLVIR